MNSKYADIIWHGALYHRAQPRQAVLEIVDFKISETELILHVCLADFLVWLGMLGWPINRVTTCLENLEMSGNLTAVRRKCQGLTKSQGMLEQILSGKSGLKLFIVRCIFASIQVFSRSLFFKIRFWYLRCCGCPWNWGRQHLAMPLKTCHEYWSRVLTGWLLCFAGQNWFCPAHRV